MSKNYIDFRTDDETRIKIVLEKAKESEKFQKEFKEAYNRLCNYDTIEKSNSLDNKIDFLQDRIDEIKYLINEAENTYSIYYDRYNADKENLISLKDDIEQYMTDVIVNGYSKEESSKRTNNKRGRKKSEVKPLREYINKGDTYIDIIKENYIKQINKELKQDKRTTIKWLTIYIFYKNGNVINSKKSFYTAIWNTFFNDVPIKRSYITTLNRELAKPENVYLSNDNFKNIEKGVNKIYRENPALHVNP